MVDKVEEVKQLFVVDIKTLQMFLTYLSQRPYAEVFEIIEAMKTAKLFSAIPNQEVTPGQAAAQAVSIDPNTGASVPQNS